MTDLILFLLAWCAIALGLTACWIAWRAEQKRRRHKEWSDIWHGQFKTAVAELDRRDAIEAAAKAKRSAAGKHARAVQLAADKAKRDAAIAQLRRAA